MSKKDRGFITIPIIAWIILGSLGLIIASRVVLNNTGYIADSQNKNDLGNQESITATPDDLVNPVKQFYGYVSTKQIDSAWNILSKSFQGNFQSQEKFAQGYKTTVNVFIKDIYVQNLTEKSVFVRLESVDEIKGQAQHNTYSGIWKLVYESGAWKLDSAEIQNPQPTPTPFKVIYEGSLVKTPTPIPQEDPQLKRLLDTYNSACTNNGQFDVKKISSGECNAATTALNLQLRLMISLMGGSSSEFEAQDRISDLEQKQRSLQDKIDAAGNCSSLGSRWIWDGYFCHFR